MKLPSPNRVAVYLTAAGGLATAVAVPLADMDPQDAASVIGGLGAIALVVREWLIGWRAHEARQAGAKEAPSSPAKTTTSSPTQAPSAGASSPSSGG